MSECIVRDLARMEYQAAWDLQRELVEQRKQDRIPDLLLFVEHPHTITFGRNGHAQNLVTAREQLGAMGIAYAETDRGGDVTYHGPGQVVGYPIVNLNNWKRDVHEYVRAIEQTLIDSLAGFGVAAERVPGATGVWTGGAKVAAIGVHISRWVTSHGFALNVETDLDYFGHIIPCGLPKPVTSLRALGVRASADEVKDSLARAFGRVFGRAMLFAEETVTA